MDFIVKKCPTASVSVDLEGVSVDLDNTTVKKVTVGASGHRDPAVSSVDRDTGLGRPATLPGE